MILLLGGVSETNNIAVNLAKSGWKVLVSSAIEIPLSIENHPNIYHRVGILDQKKMSVLVNEIKAKAIVDITHPYAYQAKTTSYGVAMNGNIPYFVFIRPEAIKKEKIENIYFVNSYKEAANLAFSFKKPILLTIGVKNIKPFVDQSQELGIDLIVRHLNNEISIQKSLNAGVSKEHIIAASPPFTVKDNQKDIKKYGIKTLVTKDGGIVGGVLEKIKAANLEKCQVVVIKRPDYSFIKSEFIFDNINILIDEIRINLIENIYE